jgi:DNA-binding response OmpR family regulator
LAGRQRVLLIEDEPNIIEAIRFVLSRDGWQVSTHPEGRGAVEAVRERAPDVVILDVMLPDRSGYDILADLKADEALRNLPVMMLTARGQTKEREMALSIGADLFMTKPFSNAEMVDAVRSLAPRRDTA